MSEFDKIIGYQSIKDEMMKLCDVIKNYSKYEKFGIQWPHGILLHGQPGLGKTLFANCFTKESGLKTYLIRKNKKSDDIITEIDDTFKKAKETQPSIIFIDDIDKFAVSNEENQDAEEFVTIQSGIDSVKNDHIFVIATCNKLRTLPESLVRAGRFDKKIFFENPTEKDNELIVKTLLDKKDLSNDINTKDIANMLMFHNCAELEFIINSAAINAGFNNHKKITMSDLKNAILQEQYGIENLDQELSKEEIHKLSLHEAGHTVVSEILNPESVGIASICSTPESIVGGFIHKCKESFKRPVDIMISLGGKCAVELYYSETCASGCTFDLNKALNNICDGITSSGTCGPELLYDSYPALSEPGIDLHNAIDNAIKTQMQHYLFKTKDILLKNKEFLERLTQELENKHTLIFSEIQNIKKQFNINNVSIY